MRLARLSVIPVLLLLQSACQFYAGASTQPPESVPNKSSQQKTSANRMQGPEYEALVMTTIWVSGKMSQSSTFSVRRR